MLAARARRLVGVYGNNDGPELRARLPEVARVELGGVRFAVVHETGAAAGRERRCAAAYPDVDVLVFGHSHIPWDTTTDSGLRLLNPGSPTDRRRQSTFTFMTVEVDAGAVTGVHAAPPADSLTRAGARSGRRAARVVGGDDAPDHGAAVSELASEPVSQRSREAPTERSEGER